ncbi:22510_t:CDS:2, partial [Cetraspora pellucida]
LNKIDIKQLLNDSSESPEQLPENIAATLPPNYDYIVSEIQQLPDYITSEGFSCNGNKFLNSISISQMTNEAQKLKEFNVNKIIVS